MAAQGAAGAIMGRNPLPDGEGVPHIGRAPFLVKCQNFTITASTITIISSVGTSFISR